LGAKDIKRSGILRLFQKCVDFLRQEVPKDLFSGKHFLPNFLSARKISFCCIFPFAKLKNSAHFF
jgi:hypothetical protein